MLILWLCWIPVFWGLSEGYGGIARTSEGFNG